MAETFGDTRVERVPKWHPIHPTHGTTMAVSKKPSGGASAKKGGDKTATGRATNQGAGKTKAAAKKPASGGKKG